MILLLLLSVTSLGCQPQVAHGENGEPIFKQSAISDIACGPSSLFNWMAHGDEQLQGILTELSSERTPVETVQYLIDTYGKRQSATNPSVKRYGTHNGGVGSVNLMLMARELLADHLESPPNLRGEYLQRQGEESTDQHFERITDWFANSIDSGVPVILYLRRYERTSQNRQPRMVFGHHVVVTSLDGKLSKADDGAGRIGFTFVDSSSGRTDHAELRVSAADFTVPTFTYRFEGERALTDGDLRTGRALLEVNAPSYESRRSSESEVMVAHFATFAGDNP